MSDWLSKYKSLLDIQPLVSDIRMGRVSPASVLYAVQQLSDEEKKAMGVVLDVILDAVKWVLANRRFEGISLGPGPSTNADAPEEP